MAANALDWRTPTLTVYDSRTLPVRQVAYWRNESGARAAALITRQRYDPAGRLIEQWDPRLFGTAPRANLASVYDLTGRPLKVDSVDAGWRLSLPGVAGQTLQRWEARQLHWRMRYDSQLRLTHLQGDDRADDEELCYADDQADASRNRRGQLSAAVDPGGEWRLNSYALSGQVMSETRTVDGHTHSFQRTCNPMGAPLSQTDAGGHRQLYQHTVTGQLREVWLQLRDQETPQPILREARYNAAAQIEMQVCANDVVNSWRYDPANGRLATLHSALPGQPPLQHLTYDYDPMGNVLRIDDHTLTTQYHRNRRVDSHRDFAYDSLYRLVQASGFETQSSNLQPGLPELISPIDQSRRYRYVEHYAYDAGNNLVDLRHVGESQTLHQHMRIDPLSNRAVRWREGDPQPVFDEYFDRHGNARRLQPGSNPLHWNARDQLARLTLLTRGNGLPDDEQTCRYSQGERIIQRVVTHTPAITHWRETLYLPGLQIKTDSNGQTLHLLSLPMGLGNVHCLHWVGGRPGGIEQNQLRYFAEDHLGSCTLELDHRGALISLEAFYPYGGVAWRAARSVIEADYRTLRFSGKTQDASGLMYFGARYYAPWLQRWVSADPAGNVDGSNLYAMVSNNPLRYIDAGGTEHTPSESRQHITEFSSVLSQMNSELKKLNYQLYNLTRTRDIYKTAGKKLAFSVVTFAVTINAGAFGATLGAGVGSLTGPAAPFVTPVTSAVGGILLAEAANKVMEKVGEETTLGYSIMPGQAALSVKSLQNKAAASTHTIKSTIDSFSLKNPSGLVKTGTETTARVIGKHLKIPYLKQVLVIARQAAHLTEALNDSWGQGDLDRIGARLDELTDFLDSQQASLGEHIENLAQEPPPPVKLVGIALMPEHTHGTVQQVQREYAIAEASIKQAKSLLGRVSAHLAQRQAA